MMNNDRYFPHRSKKEQTETKKEYDNTIAESEKIKRNEAFDNWRDGLNWTNKED